MAKIHGVNASPFVRKLRAACAEKGVDYELVVQLPFGDRTEYLKKSPLGKIPCWEEGDYVLPDSSCICAYLEKKQPTPALYPSDPQEYGRALWYEEYADTRVVAVCGDVFFERYVKPTFLKQQTDESVVSKALQEGIPEVCSYLEAELGDREWLVGKHLGIADIATASPFVNLQLGGESVDAGRFPRLADYLGRIYARPSYKALLDEELPNR